MAEATRAPTAGDGHTGPFIGRGEVLERLVRRIEKAREGEGSFVAIVGRSGVGKSTLLDVVARRAREAGFEVLRARALPTDVPEPFTVLRMLLRAFPATATPAPADGSGPLPLFLAPYEQEPDDLELPREEGPSAAGRTAEFDRLLQALVASPTERSDASYASLLGRVASLFIERSNDRPVFIALDDLPFADDSSYEFLTSLIEELPGHRLLIVATVVPPDEAPARTADRVQVTLSAYPASVVTLRPLTQPEVREFVRWLQHGRDPQARDVLRWYTQTEGNPLFITSLVRSTLIAPSVAATADGGFDQFVRAQVHELPEGDRRLLVYASVLGKEFHFPTLAKAAGGEEEQLSESLDRLVRTGLVRERGEEVYEFASERVRADVYSDLTDTRRRLLHLRAARALEATGGGTVAEVFELARHFYLGRDDAQGTEFNRRAADHSAQAFAYDTAIVYLERALECARRLPNRDGSRELRLQIELGRYLNEVGDLRQSETVLEETVQTLRTSGDRPVDTALAILGLAQTKSDLTKYIEARSMAGEAYLLLERFGHVRGQMAAHRILGVALWRQGDVAGAEEHHRASLALARAHGTPSEVGHALVDLANTVSGPQPSSEALRLYDEADQLFEAQHDFSAHARVLMNRSLLHYAAGHIEEALRDVTRAVEAAERSRSRIWLGYCLLNLAQIRCEALDPLGARQAIDRAQPLLEPLGDPLAAQQTTMIRGMIAEAEHKYADAERLFELAREQARGGDLIPQVVEMDLRLAIHAERAGRRDEARELLSHELRRRLAETRPDLARPLAELSERLAGGPPGAD
ncbi:MAG TPA: BREX system ATP-binding domain-containing protein [Thermoplasmata archaeon]|nr:BREX system ATP-binding domain-containing protein [Thermoplasmata archaeon]